MSLSSGLPGRTVSALELQGGDLGSVRKGWQVLGTAGAHGQGGFAGWQQVLAALMGLGFLRVRGGASTSLPSLLWVILPIHPVQKGSCGTISSGKESPPSQQAASWDAVGYFE